MFKNELEKIAISSIASFMREGEQRITQAIHRGPESTVKELSSVINNLMRFRDLIVKDIAMGVYADLSQPTDQPPPSDSDPTPDELNERFNAIAAKFSK